MASDVELLNRMAAGERAAVEEFYAHYLPTLWRYALAHLHPDEAAARDVVSETFVAALAQVRHFDAARGSVGAWLTGIARHKLADARRRRGLPLDPDFDTAGREEEPPAGLAAAETRTAVGRIMAALDDDQRLALEWKYLDGLSVREIARRLERTERAAEALLFRAREEFRRRSKVLLDARGELR